MGAVRVLYSDLDGTMVGPHGCFFRREDAALTLEPARALVDLHAAGVALVLVSGRTAPQLVEAARIFGADGFIGELGAVLGWDGARQLERLRGEAPAYDGTLAAQIEATGAVARLLERERGRLEYHAPWHRGHESDVMLRGLVDVATVEAALAAEGLGWLRLVDNGVLPGRDGPVHVYHLMPAGLSKGLGVARDLARRGLAPEEAVAVGDSVSDLSMAPFVRRCWLTANGARWASVEEGVSVTREPLGAGWVEVVRDLLNAPALP